MLIEKIPKMERLRSWGPIAGIILFNSLVLNHKYERRSHPSVRAFFNFVADSAIVLKCNWRPWRLRQGWAIKWNINIRASNRHHDFTFGK